MTETSRKRATLAATLTAAAIAATIAAAAPAAAAEFYEGKTISLVVGSAPGGGYDTYSRAIARHMAKHIPGNPTIVVQNMPGAGSAKAAEFIAAVAPKDGTTIGAIFPGAIVGPLLDDEFKVRYQPTDLVYLGTADSGTRVCATFDGAKTKTYADAQTQKTVIGASAAGGSTRDYALFLNNLAGGKFEVISGYKGTNEITLAMERGEVDGLCGFEWSSLKAQKSDWLRDGKLNLLLQVGLDPEPELTQKSVPEVWRYVAEADRPVVELIVAQQVFQRPYVAPPGTPEAQLKTLRQAFMATMQDKEFLADAERSGISIGAIPGERVQDLVRKMYATPKDLVERAKAAMKPAS